MKKLCRTWLIIIFALFVSVEYGKAEEQVKYNYVWLSAGTKNSNSSFALGGRLENLGFEIGGRTGGDYKKDDLLDYPVPHSDYTRLGKKSVDGNIGFDVLGFLSPLPQVSLYAGLGAYFQEYREVARSNVTGWQYTQSKTTETELSLSGGMQFFPSEMIMLGIGYHSSRGVNGQIGLRF